MRSAPTAPASAIGTMRRPGGSASSTGPAASRAHSLLAIARPSSTAAPQCPSTGGEHDGEDAQHAPQQLLGVADFKRSEAQRVGDADPQRDPSREGRKSPGPAYRETSHTPRTAEASRQGRASSL